MRYIHYYDSDIINYRKLNDINLIVENINESKTYSINEIIELFNITLCFENYIGNPSLEDEYKNIVNKQNIKLINQIIGKFFSLINDTNIINYEKEIDNIKYLENFWELIEKYHTDKKISSFSFQILLSNTKCPIKTLLKQEKLVSRFNEELTNYLINTPQKTVFLLINFYFNNNSDKIVFPKNFDNANKDSIFLEYVNSNNANLSTLFTISNLPVNKLCYISDNTRIIAKKKHLKLSNELFKQNQGITTHLRVEISEKTSYYNAVEYSDCNNNYSVSISKQWIDNNLDYPTILNNFIHIVSLVDGEFRIRHISKPNQIGVIQKLFSNKSLASDYDANITFQILNDFIIIQIIAYCEYLHNYCNIRIEDILQWFFKQYLYDEFGIKNFIVYMPSQECTYLEKCRSACCEMESIVKQYNSFVKYGEIKHDIIENSSIPIEYSNINSLIENKYAYLKINKCEEILNLLFSDQSMLTFLINMPNITYNSFFEIITNTKTKIKDYEIYQQNLLKKLIKENIIKINSDGFIEFVNLSEILILNDIYENDFADTNFCKKHLPNGFTSLCQRDWIYFTNNLLSKNESEYFNYYLNKSKFTNGLDLRNKYLHGSQPKQGTDESLHKTNYYRILMLMLILTIKINDELCLNDIKSSKPDCQQKSI